MQAKAVFKWQGSLLALFQGDQVICPGLKGPKINHSICSCLSPFLVTNTQPLGWFLRHDSGKRRVGSAQILNTFFRCCTRTNNEENVNTGSGGWQGTNTDCHPAKVLVLLEFTLTHWNTLFECWNFCTFSGSCSTELPEAVSFPTLRAPFEPAQSPDGAHPLAVWVENCALLPRVCSWGDR